MSSTEWIVGLVDMQSFYASVEVATTPAFTASRHLECDESDPPLAVTGDPERRSGIVLAASPTAKAMGVSTAMRLGEAVRACPKLICVRPRMRLYLETSLRIQETIRQMFPKAESFSIDECFFAFPYPSHFFADPLQTASELRTRIWDQFRIRCRVGLAPNKWAAKMANKAAKHRRGGVIWWTQDQLIHELHALPVTEMWGLKRRAQILIEEFGCQTIGDVARLPLGRLRTRFGVWGEVIQRWAQGQDGSTLNDNALQTPHRGYSNRTTLPRDFYQREEVAVVILELLDEVCSRTRYTQQCGRRIGLGLTYEGMTGGFFRAKTLPRPTNRSEQLYPILLSLLDTHWDGSGVRAVSVSLDLLTEESGTQLDLFENVPRRQQLWRTVDHLHATFGETSIIRTSSLLPAGQKHTRAVKIGGHFA
ncbi:DNA polymerase IV [Alicyclobacillus tolerans]|uniref:DNA polymerase-4/DNA polymerase V n=2 Tax=Alicyclobacillus tolerans TaxID=90970 RepID=A0ABT9LYF6_9BACL|nr:MULTISPECIES: DNA polymerase IV [Alicyclobacillus]MDP9729300.1 DNA polymerase-4/DNA polymerase V [Alicyclobacillus tengchongensis]QRF22334.1 DNA polymerase IV [Alicyclobacillus sp. TC]